MKRDCWWPVAASAETQLHRGATALHTHTAHVASGGKKDELKSPAPWHTWADSGT